MEKRILNAEEMMKMSLANKPKEVEKEVEDNVVESEEKFEMPQEAMFRVEGTIFIGSIQRRGKSKRTKAGKEGKISNVVTPIGYLMKEIATGRELFLEKMEAIDLAKNYGVENASIRPREHKVYDKETDEVISTQINLNLHPKRGERPFTVSDRLYPVFQLDNEGKIIKPAQLVISEEVCSPTLWNVIQDAVKTRKPSTTSKTYRRIDDEEKSRRIKKAFDAVQFTPNKRNPFSNI